MFGVGMFAQTGYGETVTPTAGSGSYWPLLFIVSGFFVATAVAMVIVAARLFFGRASGGSSGVAAVAAFVAACVAWWAADRGFDGVAELPEGLSFLSGLPPLAYAFVFVVSVVLGAMAGKSLTKTFV